MGFGAEWVLGVREWILGEGLGILEVGLGRGPCLGSWKWILGGGGVLEGDLGRKSTGIILIDEQRIFLEPHTPAFTCFLYPCFSSAVISQIQQR